MITKISFLRAVNSDDCKVKRKKILSIYVFALVFSQPFVKYLSFILSFQKYVLSVQRRIKSHVVSVIFVYLHCL